VPAFKVVSSIDINVPASRVRDALSDFNTWPIWSPWLIMERECKVTYKGTAGELGHGYDWDGQKVGAGGMTLTSLDANRMEADLLFLKPWKSKADIAFDFKAVDENKTRVKWHMDSSLPFFMFFMLGKMKAMIGGDYDRGLSMLKDYLESGEVPSNTVVEGVVDVPASLYAGKTHHTTMSDVSESMEAAFPEVFKAITDAEAEINGAPFSIYDKMDMAKGTLTYTAAIPVAASVSAGHGVQCNDRPACKALKVVHTGPYRHLGNGWSTGMSDMRHAKMKMDKSNPPFELYVNDPDNTPEESLVTEIYMPVRG